MKVVREGLEGTRIRRLVVVNAGETNHHVGEIVGYWCPECYQADETLDQIYHDEDCSFAGQHGRTHYDELEPDVPGRHIPELSPDHPITLVKAGETDNSAGVHNGEVLAFQCQCGNLDEDVFEVIHDEECGLSRCG